MTFRKKLTEMESTAAFVVGGGLTLIILGFLLSSAQSQLPNFDPSRLNIVMIVGALLFVSGSALWIFVTQPWKNFDDWSVPLYTGHDGAHHDEPVHEVTLQQAEHEDVAQLGLSEVDQPGAAVYAAPAKSETSMASTMSPRGRDDLKVLEGIGPKIATALSAAGIKTFADLAARQPAEVERVVRDAGVRMVGHTDTWIEQAKLAAQGKWAELETYKNSLRQRH